MNKYILLNARDEEVERVYAISESEMQDARREVECLKAKIAQQAEELARLRSEVAHRRAAATQRITCELPPVQGNHDML